VTQPVLASSGLVPKGVVFIPYRFAWLLTRVHGVNFEALSLEAGRVDDAEIHDAAMHCAIAAAWFEKVSCDPSCDGATKIEVEVPDGRLSIHELTRTEAAEKLGLTPQGVSAMIGRGELPARKSGRTVLIKAADIAALESLRGGDPSTGVNP